MKDHPYVTYTKIAAAITSLFSRTRTGEAVTAEEACLVAMKIDQFDNNFISEQVRAKELAEIRSHIEKAKNGV